jgi:deoxyribose-phosphate aldolase
VKTSTGFHPAGGATVEAVRLMKKHAGPLKVKASGGIKSGRRRDAHDRRRRRPPRCSAGVAIVKA